MDELDRDLGFDVRPGVVADEFEVLVLEIEEALHVGVDFHDGQATGLTGELQLGLLDVVQVEVGVARGMDEVTGLVARHLCHHLQQQGVAGDVERHAEEGVGRALVELQAEPSVGHIELEDGVTRGQRHLVDLRHVPCGDNHAP